MCNLPTIQRVSPSYVVRALIQEPYGTYIVRHQTSNDKLISSIHINNRNPSSTSDHTDRYVVLSIRVDETLYKCPIMNYRLTFKTSNGKEDHTKLLQQYNLRQAQLENYTPLKRELILSEENSTWNLNSKQFYGISFGNGEFDGKNNAGVSEAIWQIPHQNDLKVFIKCFSKDSYYFENELTLLKQICFFPIVTLYGRYSDHRYNYLVFAYGGKSLQSICPIRAQTRRSKLFLIVNIAFQIANGMIYLEKKNIIHCDLTASNILIDAHGYIRIADFGHAIQKQEGKNNLSRSVTNAGECRFQVRFLAPECLPKLQQNLGNQSRDQIRRGIYASFSSKSDVWAFGILIVQLMLQNPSKPYPHIESDRDVLRRIGIYRETHPKPDECNIDLYFILQQCWAYETIDRISFTEIREKMNMLASISR